MTEAVKEAIWLQELLQEVGITSHTATVYSDSQSALHLCRNPIYHERTKHIDVRYHFIRDKVAEKVVKLEKVGTE
ncbi:Ty1/Copia family ribonuclease HI, partial [Shigella flexneri]|nr:Ty1/Copia family ribonuclease HI [Shigella flexneri]